MKRWWLVLALLLSVGVNLGILATSAVSRLRPTPPPPPPLSPETIQKQVEKRIGELADRLELKADDRRRFLDLQHRFVRSTGPDRKRLQQVHRELRREVVSSHPDTARTEKLVAESAQLYQQIERAVVANVLETRRLLNPEQESKFLNLVENAKPGQGPFAPPGPPGPLWRRALERRERIRQERQEERREPPPVQP